MQVQGSVVVRRRKDGKDGVDAVTLRVTGNQIFHYAKGATVPDQTTTILSASWVPDYISPVLQWQYHDGAGWVSVPGATYSSFTLAYNAAYFTANVLRLRCWMIYNNVNYYDEISIVKLRDGDSNITVLLTNQSHNTPSSNEGVVSSYAGSGTTIQVYQGSTKLIRMSGSYSSGQYIITPVISPAGGITVGALTEDEPATTVTVADHSGMANNINTVIITFNIEGKSTTGVVFNIAAVQTITKTKEGAPGADAVSVKVSGPLVFHFAKGATVPDNLTVTLIATQYKGGSPTWVWQYYNAGWIDITGANTAQCIIAYSSYDSILNSASKLRVRVRLETGGAYYYDEVVINVVRDGSDGISPITIEIINQNVMLHTADNTVTTDINSVIKVKRGETYIPYGSGTGENFKVVLSTTSGFEGLNAIAGSGFQASYSWINTMFYGISLLQGLVNITITVAGTDYSRQLIALRVDQYMPMQRGLWKINTQYTGSVYVRDIVVNSMNQYFVAKVTAGDFTNNLEPGNDQGWEEFWQVTSFQEILTTHLMIAELANIANFIFYQKMLVSQAADNNNVPLLMLNGLTGYIQSVFGKIGMLNILKDKLYSKNIEISDLNIEELTDLLNSTQQTISHQASWDDNPAQEVNEWNVSSQNFTVNKKSILDFLLNGQTQGGEANIVLKLIEQCTNYSNATISVEYVFKNDDEVPFTPSGTDANGYIPAGWSASKTTPATNQVRYMSKRLKPAGGAWGEYSIPRVQLSSTITEGEVYRLDKKEEQGSSIVSVILEPGIYNITAKMTDSYNVIGELYILGNIVGPDIYIKDYARKTKVGSDGSYTYYDASHYDYYKQGYGRETREGDYGFRVRSTGFSKFEQGTWQSIQL